MVDFLRALSIVLLLGMFYLAFKNKKFKRFLLIESVLIIVFIIGRQMYTSNLNTMDTVMWSLASDVTNKMITQSDKNIENNMHDVLSTIYDGNGFDIKQNIAFEYKVKDKICVLKDLYYDVDSQTLLFQSEKIELTKMENRILVKLLEEKSKVVTREELMMELWSTDEYVSDGTLTTIVSRLRAKLKANCNDDVIHTKKGVGYFIE